MTLSSHPEEEIALRWNLANLEIRTETVQRTLEPLIRQVTTLVNTRDQPSDKRKGRSKSVPLTTGSYCDSGP